MDRKTKKISMLISTKRKVKKPLKHPSRDRVKQRNNPFSTGVLLLEQHPKEISKNSNEDEEVQKIEILCGVAIHLSILPIPVYSEYHRIYEIHFQEACGLQEIKKFLC